MAIWEKATLTAETPGARIDIDAEGLAWVRILSPSFRRTDGNDYTFIGYGCQVIAATED